MSVSVMYQWGQSFFWLCVSVWCISGDNHFFGYVCQCDVSMGTIIFLVMCVSVMYQWGQSFFLLCVSVWCINGDNHVFGYVCQCPIIFRSISLHSVRMRIRPTRGCTCTRTTSCPSCSSSLSMPSSPTCCRPPWMRAVREKTNLKQEWLLAF